MLRYTKLQLATCISLPTVSILLLWTVAIFHKNRKRWGPYDIPIVSLLVLSVIRNVCVLSYVLVVTLNEEVFDTEYCGVVVWLFNSIHTFQASILTTIAVIGLFSSKLHRNKQNLRQYLTTTHIVYHLFCLTTLCACVGVAAILAKRNDVSSVVFQNVTVFNDPNPCSFLPFELDVKFNVFILVLHLSLAVVSFGSFLLICYHHYRSKKGGNFDYLKKSNSDLSDLSVANYASDKQFYDAFRPPKADEPHRPNHINQIVWNSDTSNISTTVSSTNSRRPCLSKKQFETIEDWNRTGLETMHPVLIVSYLFYHLPVIVLCIYPKLIYPYSIPGAVLWLGLLQDLLIPVSLGIVDSRFCKWVANVYKCTGKHNEEKLPQIGLDGKFRPFGTSQPQSLEVPNPTNFRGLQTIEHRFPLANANLYTSIDGNNRLPIIQNYRRQTREPPSVRQVQPLEGQKSSSNISLHQSTHLKRQEYDKPKCINCEANLCPSHSDLHHLTPDYINKQLNYLHKSNGNLNRKSLEDITHNNLLSNSKLSRSHEHVLKISQQDVTVHQQAQLNDFYNSSDDEYVSDVQGHNYDSTSSCNSITTEANCDFEFYHKNDILVDNKEERNDESLFGYDVQSEQDYFSITAHPIMSSFKPQEYKQMMMQQKETDPTRNNAKIDINKNFKITRSNSKRSLENFQTFIETDINANLQDKLQRSNSFMTLEDRKKRIRNNPVKKLKDNVKSKNKSVECIPAGRTVFIENINLQDKYVGSVPDFKKVFISEYI